MFLSLFSKVNPRPKTQGKKNPPKYLLRTSLEGSLWGYPFPPALFLTHLTYYSIVFLFTWPCDRRFITQPMGLEFFPFFPKSGSSSNPKRCSHFTHFSQLCPRCEAPHFLSLCGLSPGKMDPTPPLTWPSTYFAPRAPRTLVEGSCVWDAVGAVLSVTLSLPPWVWFPLYNWARNVW